MKSGSAENSLEVNRQIDCERVHWHSLEGHAEAADPDDALPHHRVRNHGIVTGVPIPDQPGDPSEARGPEEANDPCAVPGKTVAAELEGDEERDDSAGENPEAWNIKDLHTVVKGVAERRLLYLVGNGHDEDDGSDWDTNDEVYVEACQVRRVYLFSSRIEV